MQPFDPVSTNRPEAPSPVTTGGEPTRLGAGREGDPVGVASRDRTGRPADLVAWIDGGELREPLWREISDLLSFRRRHPALRGERLLAVWLGSGPPAPGRSGIVALASLSGLWSLGRLAGERRDHRSLLRWLTGASGPAEDHHRRRFLPVFPTGIRREDRDRELERLLREHPGDVGDPLYQDPVSGRLTRRRGSSQLREEPAEP